MLPRALLFASDPQVAELILGLLPEFGIEVEHCPDVFGAIERLTSRSYQAIVVDWKEGLEASFLLKTTRELSSAKATTTIAVVEQKEVAGALEAGAGAVLIKPLAFDQARRTFITALPDICTERATSTQELPRQAPSPTTVAVPPRAQPLAPKLRGSANPRRSPYIAIPKPPSFAGYAQEPRRSSKHRAKYFGIGIVIVLLGMLWPTGARLRPKLVSAFRASEFILGSSTRKPDRATEPAPVAIAPVDEPNFEATLPQAAPRINRTRPLEVYASSAPVSRSLPLARRSSSNPVAPSSDPDLAAIRPEIPPSLMVPVTAMTSHAPETRLSPAPANKWSVEPILLPENVSRELLVRQVVPQYPQLAAAAGVEGSVLLHALVAKDGSIQDLKLISGPLVLGRAAFDSVKQWRYRPYRLNGQIVEMQTFVTVHFLRSPTASIAQK